MKVTLNWLKQYVDFPWTPEELLERLTMLGLEVEGMEKVSGEFEGIVVAEVLTRDKHPNADKLSLCRVADGRGERQIVCGAQNFKPGDKVPLILPGASLPAKPGEPPFTIKVGKIRGVESHGMMCSPRELGLSDDAEGLMILSPAAKVGQPFAEYLGRASADVVYDLEITPNRPDLNSVLGIAREISAVTGNPLRVPQIPDLPTEAAAAADLVGVRIEDPELCPRYTARVVRGVKIAPSPDWLRQTLEKIGVRSINNVVDITNFVMLETGQPLHAFDFDLLGRKEESARPTIVIRRAAEGEKLVTLDGQERTLTNRMLLIADETKGVALAGVMGGHNSEIHLRTVNVLIESACFKPQNIRATSKHLDLRTDASYRFERGADIEMADWASRRAAQLILEIAGGQLAHGVVDAYPNPAPLRQITLRCDKTNALLGVEIPSGQQAKFLQSLGLEVVNPSAATTVGEVLPGTTADPAQKITVRIPTFRIDLKRETDLIEEVARLFGVEKIPSTPPRGALGTHSYDALHDQIAEVRRLMTGLGLNETQGQTLISDSAARLIEIPWVPLQNPLSSDMNVLRPSLLPGLLAVLRHNLNHKNNDVAVFEVGRVFANTNGSAREERRVAVAITGQRQMNFWSGDDRHARFDISDLKGIVEEFLDQFGVRGVIYTRREAPTALYVESATITLGKQVIGELGQVLPTLARQHDLRDAAFLAELNLDLLLARRAPARSFKPLPAFPSVRRDVAMLVPESTAHDAILNVVRQTKPANLESVELFDIFRGKNIPEGQKSVAYAFTYRNPERTLTDAEVNAAHEKLVQQFRQSLKATIRE